MILAGTHSSEVKAQAERDGLVNMRNDAREKVLSGVTTVEEVLRVTSDAT